MGRNYNKVREKAILIEKCRQIILSKNLTADCWLKIVDKGIIISISTIPENLKEVKDTFAVFEGVEIDALFKPRKKIN
jgi:hypothetical protein